MSDGTISLPGSTPESNVDEKSAQVWLETLGSQWKGLDEKEVVGPKWPVFDAVELALKVSQRAKEDRTKFEGTFKTFDLDMVDSLEGRALALWAAQSRWLNARKASNSEKLDQWVERGEELRTELLDAADYIWRKDSDTLLLLRDIRQGSGNKDLADDLLRLSQLFQDRWNTASNRTDVTLEMVNEASELSTRLLSALMDEKVRENLDTRNRAWTYFLNAFEEVHDAGRYLYRRTPEAMTRYPSLHSMRKRSPSKGTTSEVESSSQPIPNRVLQS